jgi:hypothetical protein
LEALAADGGGGSVAGVDLGVVGQGEDFLANAIQEGAGAAAGEVGAADAITKEDVATEEMTEGGGVEADAVGGVSGDVEDGPGGIEEVDGGGVSGQAGDGKGRNGETDAGREAEQALEGEVGGIGGESDDGALVGGGDGGGVEDVVEVLVGKEEGFETDVLGVEPGGHALGGVEGDGAVAELEEPAIGLGDTAGKSGQCEHLSRWRQGKRWTFRA